MSARFAKIMTALGALALAACAGTPGSGTSRSSPASSATPSTAPEEAVFGRLTPRKVAKGACGLFLWSRSTDRKLVFHAGPEGRGELVLRGRELALPRTAVEGAELFGQHERQTFVHGDERLHLTITFERRPGMARGAIVPQGTLRLARGDGWEMILPVAGLVGCEES